MATTSTRNYWASRPYAFSIRKCWRRASFRARTYPKVDILNLILEGEAEYRDSDGNHVQAKAGEALLIATQHGVSYSEHNLSKEQSLTRMQLWLDACPQRENPLQQKIEVANAPLQLLASPDGE